MQVKEWKMDGDALRRLLGAANADAALLYLYLQSGNEEQNAAAELNMSTSRVTGAMAMMRQLGLWQEKKTQIVMGQGPSYTERDVEQAMSADAGFRFLQEELQNRLGRLLNIEELKILLNMVNYLGLPEEVICVLVSFCQEQARMKGRRAPALRSIEKEAYRWAEQGIDTMEEAAAYIQRQHVRASRMGQLLERLQIRGRSLSAAEEKYATAWLDMGMEDGLIDLAYERTCLNTGGMNWPYMNKILVRWHESGLRTVEDVRRGDHKPGTKRAQRQLDADEVAAIQRMMQEG